MMRLPYTQLVLCLSTAFMALGSPPIVSLSGAPEQLGRQHGETCKAEIRTMITEYIGEDLLPDGTLWPRFKAQLATMKPSLPDWYMTELTACAAASGVDPDALLFAQCEGDIRRVPGCTTFVAYGPATASGAMEIGRNFDYWGLKSTATCAKVFHYRPAAGDGLAFISVGWAGILGGWTFYNEKGLFVANNLGGFREKDPKGIPTLILARIIAQKASTLEEAIAIIREGPRMRGQALIIGQAGPTPRAAVVLYDAERVEIQPAEQGFAFHSSVGTEADLLRQQLRIPSRPPQATICAAGNSITLHSVVIRPSEHMLWVAHGRQAEAHKGIFLAYDLAGLFGKN